MDRLVYSKHKARGTWVPGPWDNEPDKVQWKDPYSGLPCLAVRGPIGAWCGYVGVGPEHPWYGKDYSKCCTLPEPCGESYCPHSPEAQMHVHGGLTFADSCDEATPEVFAKFVQHFNQKLEEHRATAVRYPRGDSAEFLRVYEPLVGDYEKWKAHKQATSICHIAGPGDFEPAWWFGFDCSHAGDSYPERSDSTLFRSYRDGSSTYKPLEYVVSECSKLAKQLAEVKAA